MIRMLIATIMSITKETAAMITAVNITAQDIIENNAHLIIELAQAGELKCVTKYVTTDGGRLTPASFL